MLQNKLKKSLAESCREALPEQGYTNFLDFLDQSTRLSQVVRFLESAKLGEDDIMDCLNEGWELQDQYKNTPFNPADPFDEGPDIGDSGDYDDCEDEEEDEEEEAYTSE